MLSLPQSVSLWIIKTTLKSPNNKPGTDLFTVYLPLLVPLVSGSLLTGKQWKSGLTPHVCTLSFNVQSPRHCQYGPSLASDLQRLLQIRGRLSHLQASAPHRRSFRMADAPPHPPGTQRGCPPAKRSHSQRKLLLQQLYLCTHYGGYSVEFLRSRQRQLS